MNGKTVKKARYSMVDKAHLHWGKTVFKSRERVYYMFAYAKKILNTQETGISGCLLGKETWANALRELVRTTWKGQSLK